MNITIHKNMNIFILMNITIHKNKNIQKKFKLEMNKKFNQLKFLKRFKITILLLFKQMNLFKVLLLASLSLLFYLLFGYAVNIAIFNVQIDNNHIYKLKRKMKYMMII